MADAPFPGEGKTKRQRYESLTQSLEQIRNRWTSKWWRDVRDLTLPGNGQFIVSEREQPSNTDTSKRIDGTATKALRTMANGILVGKCSPAQQWFDLGLQDDDLANWKPVAVWLEHARDVLLRTFADSNLYSVLVSKFLNLGGFGTAATGMYEDIEDVLRFYPYPIGSYCIANDSRLRVNVFQERCQYTVRQLVDKFGLAKCSITVKTAWEQGATEQQIEVCQVIAPNPDFNPRMIGSQFKRYLSYYYETGGKPEDVLGEFGFDEFPILAPRWFIEGKDSYGQAPMFDVLGDVKEVNANRRQKGRAIEKMVDPPLMGPSSLRNQLVSTRPNRITFVDQREGMTGLQPIYQVNFPVGEVRQDIADLQRSIKQGLYEDLFLAISNSDRRQITAEEIRARQDEQIRALSPIMERLDDEMLDPLINRGFNICYKFGMFMPPPKELQGMRLKVKYTSILSQIQKMQNLGGMERLVGFVGNNAQLMAKTDPAAWDVLDMDAINREYAASLGTPAKALRAPEEVQQIKQGRAAAQAQAEKLAQAEQAANTMKTLGETDTTNENALTDLAGDAA